MSKIRLYVETKISKSIGIKISKDQNHYLKNVMKIRKGEVILIFNSISGEWNAKYENGRLTAINCLRQKEHFGLDIWVCFSLIKPKKVNYLIEKVSEIGVTKVFPLITDHSHKHIFKKKRLQKIAVESVEQSNGINIPNIMDTVYLKIFLENFNKDREIIVCDETEDENNISSILKKIKGKKIAIFIGPVGGWSKIERDIFVNLSNCKRVSLGARLLKADTAAIYALSCIKALQIGKFK